MDREMKPQMTLFFVIAMAGLTAGLTLVIRIPIPGTGGYLNLGDMAVVFAGLFFGRWWGAVAGGIGSAMADLIGGYFVFAPVTLVAKGLEAFVAGAIGRKHALLLSLAGLVMIAIYFLAEIFMPGMGFGAALSELPFNLIQAAAGAIGGFAVFRAVNLAFPQNSSQEIQPNGTKK